MSLGAPYTYIRIDRLALRFVVGLPGLASIHMQPPASGPEIELVFGTEEGADPVTVEFLESEVEGISGYSVLASRRPDHEQDDRLAAHGADPIEAAVAYMRHILARDLPPEMSLIDAIVVVGVGEGSHSRTIYAGSDVDMDRQRVQGLLYDSLRAIALLLGKAEGPYLPPRWSRLKQFGRWIWGT